MILEVECLARETTENSLRKELERTNKLGTADDLSPGTS